MTEEWLAGHGKRKTNRGDIDALKEIPEGIKATV